MITRPLDLAAKLRPEPRSLDWMFFVNVGCIVAFFLLFGSKYVLAPALGVDFQLPAGADAVAQARAATSYISVTDSGQIFAGDGARTLAQLPAWLRNEAKSSRDQPVLLVRASKGVPLSMVTEIASAARAAGFVVMVAAVGPNRTDTDAGR